jgi:hypothetical protein
MAIASPAPFATGQPRHPQPPARRCFGYHEIEGVIRGVVDGEQVTNTTRGPQACTVSIATASSAMVAVPHPRDAELDDWAWLRRRSEQALLDEFECRGQRTPRWHCLSGSQQ